MATLKAGIFSAYMPNIPQAVRDAQAAVVKRFNPSNHDFYQVLTDTRHGHTLDELWRLSDSLERYDVLMFLDIDAIPLNNEALDSYINQAYNGILVGNIQRTNHLQNDQHTFVAPSAMAISVDVFKELGCPSAVETNRSDVAEEYTWAAEKLGIPVHRYMPLRYDSAPAEAPGGWALADGMPHYGIGTTFGSMHQEPKTNGWHQNGSETFWHAFQIRFPEHHQMFINKCDQLLKD